MTVENHHRAAALSDRVEALGRSTARSPAERTARSSRLKLFALGALGLFLVWAVLARSFAAYFADASPKAAIVIHHSTPMALLNLAERQLKTDKRFQTLPPVVRLEPEAANAAQAPTAGGAAAAAPSEEHEPESAPPAEIDRQGLAELQAEVERALRSDPLNPRAFRLLGQLSAIDSANDERTEALMQAAVRRSLLESVAVYWLIGKNYRDQNYSQALAYADVLLRTNPRAILPVMPMFGKLAETPKANRELKELLATNPPWRFLFFQYFPDTITDARTPLDILLWLKDSPAPPTDRELRDYLNFLIKHEFYDLAYYTWLQFLPAEQITKAGHLFNGSFETTPSGLPFDWVITKTAGVRYVITSRPDKPGQKALRLEFGPGRIDYREVVQIVTLPAGDYKFQGSYKSDVVSARGLEWRVTCPGKAPVIIGQSIPIKGSDPVWKDFQFSFTVPEKDCPAQTVRLFFGSRSASEQFISGSIWFDDLQITRESVAQVEQGSDQMPETPAQ